VTWRADYIEQPNGAHGIAEVAGMAEDLQSMSDHYGRIFPGKMNYDTQCVVIDAGSARITFWRPVAFVERFAPSGDSLAPRRPASPLCACAPARSSGRRRS
jgi:hypothetical protein